MIDYIITGISVCITAVSTIIAIAKGKKAKSKTKSINLAKILQTIPNIITKAETLLGAGTGKAKLEFALKELKIACLEKNVEFDEQGFTEEIEKILETPQKKE